MQIIMLFSFLMTLAKGGLLICLGILLSQHFDALISLFTGRSLSDQWIGPERTATVLKLVRWIGLFVIVMGIGVVLSSFFSIFFGMNMPGILNWSGVLRGR